MGMTIRIPAMAAGAVVLAGVAAAQPLPPVAAPPAEAAAPQPPPGPGLPEAQAGRFRLVPVPAARAGDAAFAPHSLLLDTATGRTWLLPPLQVGTQQTMIWMPVPFAPAAGGAPSPTPQ